MHDLNVLVTEKQHERFVGYLIRVQRRNSASKAKHMERKAGKKVEEEGCGGRRRGMGGVGGREE